MFNKRSCKPKIDTHIVAIWVLNECESIVSDLVDKLNTLMVGSMVNAPLKDTAPMAVSSDFDAVCSDSVVNELCRM